MAFDDSFLDLCDSIDVGQFIYNEDCNEDEFIISMDELKKLSHLGRVFVVLRGGLLLGRLHKEGGIHLLKYNEDGNFKCEGEMEGWEYYQPIFV